MHSTTRVSGIRRSIIGLLAALPLLTACPATTPPVDDTPAVMPTIESFTADDPTITTGTSTTLRWTVTNTTNLTLNDGTTDLTLDPTTTHTNINPTTTTTYTLTATNDDGTTTATTTVNVTNTPTDPPNISSLEHEIVLGSRARLTWTSTSADTFEVLAVTAEGNTQRIGDLLESNDREITVDIPVATRQTLRVCAIVDTENACAETLLTNVVTTTADWDPYYLEGFTPEPSIPGSLRSIILAAEPQTIIGFAADIREIELRGVDLIRLTPTSSWIDAHLVLNKDITISGPADKVTLRGVPAYETGDPGDPFTYRSRMVYVAPDATVHLDQMTLTGGTFIFRGGSIRNAGDLTITRAEISNNRAWASGGGISNQPGGVLWVEDSVLEGNRAVTEIEEIGTTYAIRDGYVICMRRFSFGGGLHNEPGAIATFVDSPIRDNEATVNGGGVFNEGSLTLIRSNVTANQADHRVYTEDPTYPDPPDFADNPDCSLYEGPFAPTSYGGGIYQAEGATLELIDTTITGNTVDDLYVAPTGTGATANDEPTQPTHELDRER